MHASQTHPSHISDVSFTHFRRILHTFQTCLAHIPDASLSGEKGAWHSPMSCCSFIVRFCACMDKSCLRFRDVSHSFQMHANVTLELSCTSSLAKCAFVLWKTYWKSYGLLDGVAWYSCRVSCSHIYTFLKIFQLDKQHMMVTLWHA